MKSRITEKHWLILSLACIQYLILADYLIVMPIGPNLMQSLHITTSQFAGLVSVYSLGAITIAFLTAGFLDRFDQFLELRITFFLFLAVSALHFFANSYPILLLLRFLSGGLAGLCGSLVMSVISQNFSSKRRGSVIGVVLSSTSVSQIIGIPLGLYLVVRFGWKSAFLLTFVLGLMMIIPLMFTKSGKHDTSSLLSRSGIRRQTLQILAQPNHFKAMSCTLLTMLSGTLIIPFLPLVLVYQYKVPEPKLGTMYLFAGIAAFILSLIAGKWSEKESGKAAIFSLYPLGIFPLILFMSGPNLSFVGLIGLFAVTNAVLVVRMIPMNRFVLEFIHPHYLSGFQSINTAMMHIGASSAAWIGGLLITVKDGELAGFNYTVLLAVFVLALLFLLIHFGLGSHRFGKPVSPTLF